MEKLIDELRDKVLTGGQITSAEAMKLMVARDNYLDQLCAAADAIRQHYKGDFMETCSILNARSGRCTENCKWCSQSMFHKTEIEEYELVDLTLAAQRAQENAEKGVHRFSLVTSGRALSNKNLEQLCRVYKSIRQKSNIHLCASMGLLRQEQMHKLKAAGVEHYHCNLETAPSYFSQLCTTHTIEEKVKTIEYAKKAGLKVCSGGIIGMGETKAQRLEMAFTLRELAVDSIPVNILTPIEGTPLEGTAPLTDEEVLTTLALFRFINPTTNIRLAGGRNRISHMLNRVLKAGVSAAMVGDYLTTLGCNIEEDKVAFTRAGFRF